MAPAPKGRTPSTAAAPPARKRRIEQYDHKDKQRANNPPVGLVTPDTDKNEGRKTYASTRISIRN